MLCFWIYYGDNSIGQGALHKDCETQLLIEKEKTKQAWASAVGDFKGKVVIIPETLAKELHIEKELFLMQNDKVEVGSK